MTVIEAAWLQAAVVVPLLFHVLSFRVFEPEKTAALRLFAVIALAGIGVAVAGRSGRSSLAFRRLRSPLCVVVAALLGATVLSTALSVDVAQSLLGSYHRQSGLLTLCAHIAFFAAITVGLQSRAQLDRLLAAVTLGSLAAAAYALLQRFELDPLSWDAAAWGGDPIARTPGTLGNPTFLAGYLAVTIFATAAYARRRRLAATALAVQAAGLWATGSRGALVAAGAGLIVFLLALAVARGARRLAAAIALLGAAGVTVLLLLNVPGGPLDSIRDAGPWRRVAHVFDGTDERSRVRLLIWKAAHDALIGGTALETVGGTVDPYQRVRRLVGYGPETLQIPVARLYPPELARLERPDAIVDRAHNDLVEALATGGGISLALMMAAIGAVLLTGCRALGLGGGSLRACASGMALAAGAVVCVGAVTGRSWLIVPGLGIAMVGGFGATLGAVGMLRRVVPRGSPAFDAAALTAAVTAHVVDVQMGIATVASRSLFWLFAGCLVWLATTPHALEQADAERGRKSPTLGWLAASALATIGFGFAPDMILGDAAWRAGLALAGIAAVVLAIAASSAILRWREVPFIIGATTLAVLVFVILAWRGGSPTVPEADIVDTFGRLAVPVIAYLTLAVAAALAAAWRGGSRRFPLVTAAVVTVPALLLVARPLTADVLVRGARQLEVRGYPAAAVPLHEAAADLMPYERQYRVAAAGAVQLAAAQQKDARARDLLFARAAATLSTDYTREFDLQRTFASARLNGAWAAGTADPLARIQRGAQANAFYQRLVTLSPTNPLYWNDWAALALEVFSNPTLAQTRLEHSQALDPYRSDTARLIAAASRVRTP